MNDARRNKFQFLKKTVLIIVPYDDIYPPMNGGMQRCFHIIHQLARHFELTIIINQSKEGFQKAINDYPVISGINVYSTKDEANIKDVFSFLPIKFQQALRYRWYKRQLNGPADGLLLQYYPVLVRLLKKHKYDIIILENLASLNAISVIRKYDKQVNIIYDAHNVDSNLALVAVEKWAMKKEYSDQVNMAEKTLYKTIDAIFTCSKNDLDDFVQMNQHQLQGVVIPNGVSIANYLCDEGVQQANPEYILFCGTLGSQPNCEGLLWFYNTIWPIIKNLFPGLKLLVVGSGKVPENVMPLLKDQSLHFTGSVDDVKPWYNKASVAVVPLLSGSGTRLKILEAMSLGLPIVSTSKGAEGITYTNDDDILIADTGKDFANSVNLLLHNKNKRISLQQAARKLAEEKYDWNVIGGNISSFINKNIFNSESKN